MQLVRKSALQTSLSVLLKVLNIYLSYSYLCKTPKFCYIGLGINPSVNIFFKISKRKKYIFYFLLMINENFS